MHKKLKLSNKNKWMYKAYVLSESRIERMTQFV